jgi:hypothetical protein
MKKNHPAHIIRVAERKQLCNIIGWGVVFSDATMDGLRSQDAESAAEIEPAGRAWQHARMNHGYGIEQPGEHTHTPHRTPVRYLVLIDAAGSSIARLYLATRELAAEFDGGTEEVARMTRGLSPSKGAEGPEWDQALEGHSSAERRAAGVYTLDV